MSFLQEYTLLGELGQGGFAKVYKVRHNELGYIRAIRVLNEPVTDEKSRTYQKFLRECKVLLRLGNGTHPNIVHIYQPRLLENHALVEMDFVDGKDLNHYLADNGYFVPTDEVLRMAKEISSALAYCHEDIYRFCMDRTEDQLQDDPADGSKVLIDEATRQRLINKYKVIHNDIHSGNIIRREDGSFVLLDFGLAITDGADVRNSSRHENGAIEYKAPEKWEDDAVLTEQSDVYSFGIVMYEYLAGRVPFPFDVHDSNRARSVFALWEAHKSQTPPPIFDIRKAYFEEKYPGKTYEKDYPDWIEEAIMKCLEKDPKKRFKSGKELNEYICQRLDEQGVAALRSSNQSLSEENELLKARLKQAEEEAKRRIEAIEQEAKERAAKLAQERHTVPNSTSSINHKPYTDFRRTFTKIKIFDIFGTTKGKTEHYYVYPTEVKTGVWKTRIDELRNYLSNEVTSCYMTWCMIDYGWWLSKAIYSPSRGGHLMFSVCIGSHRPKDGLQAIALLDELASYFSNSENWNSEYAYSKLNDLELAFDVAPCETVDFAEPSLPPKAAYWIYDTPDQLANMLTYIRQNRYEGFSRVFFISQDQTDGMNPSLENLNGIIRIRKVYTIVLPEDDSCTCNKKEVFEGETAQLTYRKNGMWPETVVITGGKVSQYCIITENEMLVRPCAEVNTRFNRAIEITCSDKYGHTYDNFKVDFNGMYFPAEIKHNTLIFPEDYNDSIELYVISTLESPSDLTSNDFKATTIRINPSKIRGNSFNIVVEPLTAEDIERIQKPAQKEKKSSFLKKYWYVILLGLLPIYAAWEIVNMNQGNGRSEFGKMGASTRQQLIDNMSTSDIWKRDQIPSDLQSVLYDNIYNGNYTVFFSEVGNGNQVKDTLFNFGHAKINPKWTRMIDDLQFIRTEGQTAEGTETRTKINSICSQAGYVDLAQIVQATGEMKDRIEERKRQQEAELKEKDLDYMKHSDIWTRINLWTAEYQELFDKIVEGDMNYLLQIAQNIDNQPKEKTNGYWIAICHELTAMAGDNTKLAMAQEVLTTNCSGGSINLVELFSRIRSINNPANPNPRPTPKPKPSSGNGNNGDGNRPSV